MIGVLSLLTGFYFGTYLHLTESQVSWIPLVVTLVSCFMIVMYLFKSGLPLVKGDKE